MSKMMTVEDLLDEVVSGKTPVTQAARWIKAYLPFAGPQQDNAGIRFQSECASEAAVPAPTIEELIGRLEEEAGIARGFQYITPAALMNEAALALRELVQGHKLLSQQVIEWSVMATEERERADSLRHSLTQHKDWLREALDQWKHWAVLASPLPFERIAQIRKLMEGE